MTADWHAAARAIAFDGRPFIGGEVGASRSRASFATVCPATEQPLATMADGNAADIDRAVAAARRAFAGGWRSIAPERRQAHLRALADAMHARRDELALMDCLEMGMPIGNALAAVDEAVRFTLYYAAAIGLPRGEVADADAAAIWAMNWYEPRGVVGIISSWNFPLLVAASAIAPAIAAGNTVVAKPSPIAPSSVLALARIAAEAGLPAGVINAVAGGGEAGAALAGHGDVDQIGFVGSAATGRRIMVAAGQSNGKPVMLEGGGKSPQIVFADAVDLDGLADSIAASAFANSGQICVARTRLLVERGQADALIERVREATARLFTVGDPLDPTVNYGPLASLAQRDRVRSYLDIGAAERAGHRPLATGGTLPGRVYFVAPGIFAAAAGAMRVAREEIFGPLIALIPFADEAEAVRIANETEHGLAATIWTRDIGRARRMARDIDAGRIDIRTSAAMGAPLQSMPAEPFGGSGHGVLGGLQGMRAYQRLKAVQIVTG